MADDGAARDRGHHGAAGGDALDGDAPHQATVTLRTTHDAGLGPRQPPSTYRPDPIGPRTSLSEAGLEGGVTLAPATGSAGAGSSGAGSAPAGPAAQGDPPPASGAADGEVRTRRSARQRPAEVLSAGSGGEKYAITGELARGGMGVILRAVDRDIRRDVAMKLLKDAPAVDERDRERFIEEAQVTGQLEHPNIVPIHELGVADDGRLFFTMKLVKGRSLGQALADLRRGVPYARGEYSLGRLLAVFMGICNAMAFAHARGVVHRDLKPHNVMLGDFGEVLVMDWGLARVGAARQWTRRPPRTGGAAPTARSGTTSAPTRATTSAAHATPGAFSPFAPPPDAPVDPAAPSGSSAGSDPGAGHGDAADEELATIVHSLRSDGEAPLTQEGTVEGTPAYMPPEQARGEIARIDERSDIYALGAILYEMLALAPPVGGKVVREILDNAIANRVVPPERRAPHRDVPPELSAVAMQALAADPADRYQTAVALREDIERFLDGRSVTAKDDSLWEVVVKVVKRNRGAATATAVAIAVLIVVLVVSFRVNLHERRKAEGAAAEARTALVKLRDEQDGRSNEQKRTAPALVERARRAVERKAWAYARQDADLALAYDPELVEARMLRAQLMIRDQDYAPAVGELNMYLRFNPDDADARTLIDLCMQAIAQDGRESSANASALADVFVRQGAYVFAQDLFQSSQEVARIYRSRLEKAWPGCTRHGFAVDSDGRLLIDSLRDRADVGDLAPLAGMPVARLRLGRTRVIDLSPLKDMPLMSLDLSDTPIRDLSPLQGMALTSLTLANTRVADLSPLTRMPLEELDCSGTRVDELSALGGSRLRTLRLVGTPVSDLAPLAGLPLSDLDLGGSAVADLAPLAGMKLVTLRLAGSRVTDLAALRGMPLTALAIDNNRVADLGPLKGMPLRAISLTGTAVADLSPLTGMAISSLDLSGLPVSDLAALARMPLASLNLSRTSAVHLGGLKGLKLASLSISHTRIAELGPLRGMPLSSLDCAHTPVIDLTPLKGGPIATLVLDHCPVTDIAALRGMPLKELRLAGVRCADLTPLAGMSIERLVFSPKDVTKGIEAVRGMVGLRHIAATWDGSWGRVSLSQDFWKRHDRGDFAR